MENARTRNDLGAALVRFCVAIEEHRRTPEGRVRTPSQFLGHFFATEDGAPKDEVFRHMPKEVRGPILSSWGIRGAKAALRDDDAKVAAVVFDALAAGDLDADAFESALTADKLLAWVPLASFWSFWRAGALSKPSLLRAFTTAYELRLLDARAFFDTLKARNGELVATEVLGNAFTKDDLIEWMRRVHASGDGTPKGLLEAATWDKVVAKAPTEALLGALDALAVRLGLAIAPPADAPIPAPSSPKTSTKSDSTPPEEANTAAETPAGAEVEIETHEVAQVDAVEVAGPKTDPPSAPVANDDSWSAPPSDLAKTGPYATPSSTRTKRDDDDEEDDSEETKLYRQRPLQRR